jgi:type I restriction enzyme, S subunit
LHERSKISRLLNGEMSRIDRLVFAAREAIALLKERRSALITAAVTGQIDVRGAAGAAHDQPQPTGETLAP